MQGYEKNSDFRPIPRFVFKTIEYTAIITVEGEYETVHKHLNGVILNDIE